MSACILCGERRAAIRNHAHNAEAKAQRGQAIDGHLSAVAALKAEIAACDHARPERRSA